jgi:glycosyltransferase involved in cell wall biosynthesis
MPAAKRVGLVANLRSVKNIESLVRAADKLATKHPNARFEIAGEGDCRVQLQKLIDALKLRDRVILLGSVENIPKFLATLDVAVLCSLSEGSPNAIMEYMATGLPTIATDVGGSSELIEHEVTGLLVPAGNDAQLAAAIDRLLCDDGFAEKLGANARARAFSEFSVESQARRYEDFYITLMQKKQVRK